MANLLTSLTSAAGAMGAYEKAMEVVQNDTVNANAPGYVKQSVVLQSLPFDLVGGQAGGVTAAQVLSSRDEYAEHNVQIQQTALGLSSTLASHLSALEPVFDLQSTTGIAGSLNSLFSAFSQLTIAPNDAQARQSVVSAASSLSVAFNVAANSIAGARNAVDTDTRSTVADINQIVADIQKINVALRNNAQENQDPGLDSRLHVDLENLAQYAGFSTIQAQDGTVSIFMGDQRPLLIGTTQYTISAATGAATQILDSNGNDITANVNGGQLGALVRIRNTTLPQYQSQLDQLAQNIADTINSQLASGVDQAGAAGAPLFAYSAAAPAKTLAVTSITASQLAAASSGNPGGNDNAVTLSGLQNAAIGTLGGFTFTQFYGALSSTIGRDISNAQDDQTTQQQLLAQAQSLRSQSSSVSLDEEAARLLQYQQAYEATGKLITVINQMTQTLMGLIPTN